MPNNWQLFYYSLVCSYLWRRRPRGATEGSFRRSFWGISTIEQCFSTSSELCISKRNSVSNYKLAKRLIAKELANAEIAFWSCYVYDNQAILCHISHDWRDAERYGKLERVRPKLKSLKHWQSPYFNQTKCLEMWHRLNFRCVWQCNMPSYSSRYVLLCIYMSYKKLPSLTIPRLSASWQRRNVKKSREARKQESKKVKTGACLFTAFFFANKQTRFSLLLQSFCFLNEASRQVDFFLK